MRVALVTNIPAPYRIPVYEILGSNSNLELHVFFFSGREPDREWDLAGGNFQKTYLKERFITINGRFIHFNPDLWAALRDFAPQVVITTGFNPSHLLAFLFTKLHGGKHIAMTDGTLNSEKKLSPIHRLVRRLVYAGTHAYIGASQGAFKLYESYGIKRTAMHQSHLCANNAAFSLAANSPKTYDFIFCGRFTAIKSPLFAIEVAKQVAQTIGRKVSLQFVGSGDMEPAMRAAAQEADALVHVDFKGFASQNALPALYSASKIFLFPTVWDPWGVVANEAAAAGVPVLVSPHAGAANEIIQHGFNGYVIPLDLEEWVSKASRLLTDEDLYKKFAANGPLAVKDYTYTNAANGIARAVEAATSVRGAEPKGRSKVVVIQRRLTHYRLPFFELLRAKLNAENIDLVLVYGDPTEQEKKKNDSGELAWGVHVPCKYWLDGKLCWQNASAIVADADLVVITQENKLLQNLQFLWLPRRFKLGFWGHGANMQSRNTSSLLEKFKRLTSKKVDWWFAYTKLTADIVSTSGFQHNKISILNNAVDTQEMAAHFGAIQLPELVELRAQLGLHEGPTAVFVGSLYEDKRFDFLMKVAEHIRQRVPNFQLLLVGDGPERTKVEAWCKPRPWARWVGSKFGREKVAHIKLADIMLNPGLVGLGILDSFVCQVPMVTTDCGLHSPEIAYLNNGMNGLMTSNTVTACAEACIDLLQDSSALQRLKEGCAQSATTYTVENMASHFAAGIQGCLAAPRTQARA